LQEISKYPYFLHHEYTKWAGQNSSETVCFNIYIKNKRTSEEIFFFYAKIERDSLLLGLKLIPALSAFFSLIQSKIPGNMIPKIHFYLLFFILFTSPSYCQISFNATGAPADPSSAVDIQDTQKGLLIPRMTKVQRDQIAAPATSLLVYQTTDNSGYYYNAGTPQSPVWTALDGGQEAALTRTLITALPYEITQPGSYLLAGHLTGATGITISTSGVTLDLNQYTLTGASGNTSKGVRVAGEQSGIRILNGSVKNWAGGGIDAVATTGCTLMNIAASGNGQDGITSGAGALISHCTAHNNTLDGIDVGQNSGISHCLAFANGDNGIEADNGVVISDNTCNQNTKAGIYAGSGCTLRGNTCFDNGTNGLESGSGSLVDRNTCAENTQTGFVLQNGSRADNNHAKSNGGHGFSAQQDVVLTSNSADSNGQNGFYSTFDGGKMDGNQSSDNAVGYFISGSGWLIIRNSASGNTGGGFQVGPSNAKATVLTTATLNTSSNPNANVDY
jgi:parallel beta-helix repeat protein